MLLSIPQGGRAGRYIRYIQRLKYIWFSPRFWVDRRWVDQTNPHVASA